MLYRKPTDYQTAGKAVPQALPWCCICVV